MGRRARHAQSRTRGITQYCTRKAVVGFSASCARLRQSPAWAYREAQARPVSLSKRGGDSHQNGTSFWGTVADLSLGGCYVEMPIPLQPGTKLKVGIWIGQTKVMAESAVAHRTPGLGVGIRFNQISNEDLDAISLFLSKLAPFARNPFLRAT